MTPHTRSKEVTAVTVCTGDTIAIGDVHMTVMEVTPTVDGGAIIRFESGETLRMHSRTALMASRRGHRR
ncbi:hypothetical protein N0X72_25265 [Streptomyces carpaticus]|uniref:hypothetical protein n=1 Tax=Streptomyces carpaticus TaxID=285558 RepID=UPI002204B214|nr:hypothetical protein N0X72_25265 [Streptomyces carpaticus]